MALDTKTNQILTITAEYGPVPVAPVAPAKVASVTTSTGGPPPATPPSGIPSWMLGPRPPMIPGSFQILVMGK